MLNDLPAHLAERVRWFKTDDLSPHDVSGDFGGDFILYWMRTAVRGHENPALDVATHLADRLKLPLLVYQAISQHYRYASDRHHLFMLQGARDVQAELSRQGISYAFHLATKFDHRPHLIQVAHKAAVVVTEDMPVDPPRRFLKKLNQSVATPIACVDTACIAPMQQIGKSHTRAFQFRAATKPLYDQRLTAGWPAVDLLPKQFSIDPLPFQTIDLQTADLHELISQCEIDHAVAPVVDTVGGSLAGYQRWNQFKQKGLASYAKRRNNALIDGVSRMSAYLHYGMVSPLRIAREAAEIDNAGSEKYLDELLIWRELAYNFCFHREDHDQWSALPSWAQETLQAHSNDRRQQTYTWEQLARGQTDDPLWNAAQLSLLRNGELHNNVRMTWGKAILNWTHQPQQAMQYLFDLNHRYALDGRDPASYGGLLWCLGQFDRPFSPEQNVIGTVRPRPTHIHAQRLNPESFFNKVAAPRFPIFAQSGCPKIAVVGSGISGLFAARTLTDHGLDVRVFDKGRSAGGRMSTRQVDGQPCFDHGAQYFTARDTRFQTYVQSWRQQGVVAIWPNANDPHHGHNQKIVAFKNGQRSEKQSSDTRYVGIPGMNQICQHLADGIDVRQSVEVGKIEPTDRGQELFDRAGISLGKFDYVIVSTPAAQAASLLNPFPKMTKSISQVNMQPCWAVMATLESPLQDNWAGAFVQDSIVSWACRNGTKPGRPRGEYLLLHGTPEWTTANWDLDPEKVAEELLAAFWQTAGLDPVETIGLQTHRWKYAIASNPPPDRCFFDPSTGIAACGDWAGGPRVEGAFLSGMAAAGRVLGSGFHE